LIIGLLGRKDSPTDAVEDYCRWLGTALKARGVEYELARLEWEEKGWLPALSELWRKSARWKSDWVLAQYTALAWSHRGFSLRFLLVLGVLRIRQAPAAVLFHDVNPFGGRRLVDRLKRACQTLVMRAAYALSDATVVTVPLKQASWLPRDGTKATFIPVGANLPVNAAPTPSTRNGHEAKTITVFGVTDGGDISQEVRDITVAAKRAAQQLPHVRLVTLGRGSAESACRFRQALEGSAVEYSALGIRAPEDVSKVLATADLALFVRGPVSTQRGTAIASIAHAVPLVAYSDACLPTPLAEAGVVGVPYLDGEELANATVRVLTDPQLWDDLHERSRRAYQKYFSWEAVANRFLEVLHDA
jgi:glycosyltransferase involved in cell wall biosynthesis